MSGEDRFAPDGALWTGQRPSEEDEPQLASLIRPLPEDILPSPRFLEALRFRLLTLPGAGLPSAPLRAA